MSNYKYDWAALKAEYFSDQEMRLRFFMQAREIKPATYHKNTRGWEREKRKLAETRVGNIVKAIAEPTAEEMETRKQELAPVIREENQIIKRLMETKQTALNLVCNLITEFNKLDGENRIKQVPNLVKLIDVLKGELNMQDSKENETPSEVTALLAGILKVKPSG